MSSNLQIICFKLNHEQLKEIDTLIFRKLYFSRSEVLRYAIRHLLSKIAQDLSYQGSTHVIWEEKDDDTGDKTKESVSSKFPPKLLECVDKIVAQGYYQSRSHFIRESLELFLSERKPIHDMLLIE